MGKYTSREGYDDEVSTLRSVSYCCHSVAQLSQVQTASQLNSTKNLEKS